MTGIDASFGVLRTNTEVAELVTAAASGVVHRRREAVADREHESDCLPAIADYTDRAHHAVTTAHHAIRRRYGIPRQDLDPYCAVPAPSDGGTPKRRQVLRGLTAARETLAGLADNAREVLNRAARDTPYVPATAELARTVHCQALAACGQLSVAHHSYQRAIQRRRKPLGLGDFHLQTAGLVYGLQVRIPGRAWRILEGFIHGGEYSLALEDLVATLITHGIDVTNVEHEVLTGLLQYLEPTGHLAAIAARIGISQVSDRS